MTRQKNKRGDSKMKSNDSPEIPDRGRHQTSPASLRGESVKQFSRPTTPQSSVNQDQTWQHPCVEMWRHVKKKCDYGDRGYAGIPMFCVHDPLSRPHILVSVWGDVSSSFAHVCEKLTGFFGILWIRKYIRYGSYFFSYCGCEPWNVFCFFTT